MFSFFTFSLVAGAVAFVASSVSIDYDKKLTLPILVFIILNEIGYFCHAQYITCSTNILRSDRNIHVLSSSISLTSEVLGRELKHCNVPKIFLVFFFKHYRHLACRVKGSWHTCMNLQMISFQNSILFESWIIWCYNLVFGINFSTNSISRAFWLPVHSELKWSIFNSWRQHAFSSCFNIPHIV